MYQELVGWRLKKPQLLLKFNGKPNLEITNPLILRDCMSKATFLTDPPKVKTLTLDSE